MLHLCESLYDIGGRLNVMLMENRDGFVDHWLGLFPCHGGRIVLSVRAFKAILVSWLENSALWLLYCSQFLLEVPVRLGV